MRIEFTNDTADHVFKIVFYALCLFYIICYAPYGLEGTDTGYIFGTSWNIYNGQLPHRDFIYTRPAIPAYFHTIFLYLSEVYGYFLDRCFFYAQLFIYSLLGSKLLVEYLNLDKSLCYFFAALAAVVSIHNYPPMGWNTVDGVFFCMVGLYFILRNDASWKGICFGTLMMVMGTFSKQSFYFMPIFLLGYLIVTKNSYTLKYYLLFGLIWVFAYVLFLLLSDSFFPFIEQTFSRTESSALYNSGFRTYYLAIKTNKYAILFGVVAAFFSFKFIPRTYLYLIFNIVIASCMIAIYLDVDSNKMFKKSILQILFVIASFNALWQLRNDKKILLVILLLGLSWSASISNGFKTPIHFSLPILVSIFILFFSMKNQVHNNTVLLIVLLLFVGVFYLGYQTIYRESDRSKLNYNAGDVFDKLSFIKTDKASFEKFEELKMLFQKYPNFTVIPSITQAHYLTNTINPIGIDWPLDVETNNTARSILRRLEEKNVTVFVETSEFSEKELKGYDIMKMIQNDWSLIATSAYFKVYQKTP